MASIDDTMAALANTIADGLNIRADDHIPDKPATPACYVGAYEIIEDTFGFGTMDVTFDVVFLAPRATSQVSQKVLAGYASQTGDSSVWTCIAADTDLGLGDGTVARVSRVRTTGVLQFAEIEYLTVTASVEVTCT